MDTSFLYFSDGSGSHGSSEVEKTPGSVIVHLSKNKKSIGTVKS